MLLLEVVGASGCTLFEIQSGSNLSCIQCHLPRESSVIVMDINWWGELGLLRLIRT